MKKYRVSELIFFVACVFSAAGIHCMVASELGLSMIAAPAYIISQKISWLSQGNAEWMVQGLVFLVMCLMMRRFLINKIWCFAAAVVYGWIFDGVGLLMKWVQPVSYMARLGTFLMGCVLLSFGIALFFKSYLPCQVHEMFVKVLSESRGWKQGRVKLLYDIIFLFISVSVSFLMFHRLIGIREGTVICTLVNGPLIDLWLKLLSPLDIEPAFPRLKVFFDR